MKPTQLLVLAAFVSAPALAAPTVYTIDATHTYPRFSYNHLGFSTQLSRFNKTSGSVTLDSEARTGSVDVTIDVKSVDTGYGTFDEHIQGPDFLDTKQYPMATFKSTAVKFDGDRPASVDGVLTIKGVSKLVTLKVTSFTRKFHPMLKRDAIGANATTVIKRSEFNAGKHAPFVGDEVTLEIAMEANAP
jgi:polyisoprenoid-binding protein YceI